MSALDESHSIEAEIAECYQAIYWATDSEKVLQSWTRLRKLIAVRTEAEDLLFKLERRNDAVQASP